MFILQILKRKTPLVYCDKKQSKRCLNYNTCLFLGAKMNILLLNGGKDNDVIKNPQVEQYLSDYQAHLETVFG